MRLTLVTIATITVLVSTPCIARTQTVDDKFKKAEKNDSFKIVTLENTKDQCRKCRNVITIHTKSDGQIQLKCGERVYFDVPNQDGSWRWDCGNSRERARIASARFIRATRAANGEVLWEWVQLELK